MPSRSKLAFSLASLVVAAAASNGFSQTATLQYDFEAQCVKKIEVTAQQDGLISEMNVDEGSQVPHGGILFRIDNRVAQAQLEIATREFESAKVQAEQDADVKYAKATHGVAQAELESEEYLVIRNAGNVANVRRAKLERDKAMFQIDVAEAKRVTDRLAVNVAAAKRDAAQVQLTLYDIVAPWDAVVDERLKAQGAWTRAGEPVLKIHHMDEMRIVGFIPYSDLLSQGLAPQDLQGAPIRISVATRPNQPPYNVDSTIEFVSSVIDTSKRLRVWAKVQNQRVGNSWLLREGMPTKVTIAVGR